MIDQADPGTAYYRIVSKVVDAHDEQHVWLVSRSGYYSTRYAMEILHAPFPLGEKAILEARSATTLMNNRSPRERYLQFLMNGSLSQYLQCCIRNSLPLDTL